MDDDLTNVSAPSCVPFMAIDYLTSSISSTLFIRLR